MLLRHLSGRRATVRIDRQPARSQSPDCVPTSVSQPQLGHMCPSRPALNSGEQHVRAADY